MERTQRAVRLRRLRPLLHELGALMILAERLIDATSFPAATFGPMRGQRPEQYLQRHLARITKHFAALADDYTVELCELHRDQVAKARRERLRVA